MFECVESSVTFNPCLRQGSVEAPRLWQMMAAQILASVESGHRKTWASCFTSKSRRRIRYAASCTHGWLIAALLREMSGLSDKATFECVESNFSFTSRKRGKPTFVAEDGNPDSGQCGGRMDKEKKGIHLGHGR